MSPERQKLLQRVADALMALYDYDEQADAAGGSPDPVATALAAGLSTGLTLVRVALAHAGALDSYEPVIEMARELEVESWKQHRATCSRCGVQ